MTWFSTDAFRFELPEDGWIEQTVHVFHPPNDPKTGFVITRVPSEPDGAGVERSLQALPEWLYDEREVLRSERRYFGTAEAEDVSFLARKGMDGSYFRVVAVPYYGRELSFQWMGPIADREQVDARVERALAKLRFWSPT